jgi:hypothetical protein
MRPYYYNIVYTRYMYVYYFVYASYGMGGCELPDMNNIQWSRRAPSPADILRTGTPPAREFSGPESPRPI